MITLKYFKNESIIKIHQCINGILSFTLFFSKRVIHEFNDQYLAFKLTFHIRYNKDIMLVWVLKYPIIVRLENTIKIPISIVIIVDYVSSTVY